MYVFKNLNMGVDVYGNRYSVNDAMRNAPELAVKLFSKLGFCYFVDVEREVKEGELGFVQLPSPFVERIEQWFTPTCNKMCSYCCFKQVMPYEDMKDVKLYFDLERAKKVISRLKCQKYTTFAGEPSLFPDVIEKWCLLLDELGAPSYVKLEIATNGELVDVLRDLDKKVGHRLRWLITVDSVKAEGAHNVWNVIGQYDFDFDLRLLVSGSGMKSLRFLNPDHVSVLKSVYAEKDYWKRNWLEVEKILEFDNIVTKIFDMVNPVDMYGSATTCIVDQLFEVNYDGKYGISGCVFPTGFGEKTIDVVKFDVNSFSLNDLYRIRDYAWYLHRKKRLFHNHCIAMEEVFGGDIEDTEIVEGTIAAYRYGRNKKLLYEMVSSAKRYFDFVRKVFDCEIDLGLPVVDVLVVPVYSGYDWRNDKLNIGEIESWCSIMGKKVRKVFDGYIELNRNGLLWEGMDDRNSVDVVIVKDNDIECLKFINDYICFMDRNVKVKEVSIFCFGRGYDVYKLLKGKARISSEILQKFINYQKNYVDKL